MKKVAITLVTLSFLSILAGCGSDDSELRYTVKNQGIKTDLLKSTDKSIETDLVYLSLKKDLFKTSCIQCHNPEKAIERGRLDLTNKNAIIENADDIVYRMTTAFDTGVDFMPPKDARVSAEVVEKFKSWSLDARYANLQENLFAASCTKCHNPDNKKRLDLTSKEAIIEKYDDILYRMTDAFKPEGEKKPMPPLGKGIPAVSEKLINELKNWKAVL